MELTTNNRLHHVCAARDEVLDLLTQAQQLIVQAKNVSAAHGLGNIETMFRNSQLRFKPLNPHVGSRNSKAGSDDIRVAFLDADRATIGRFVDAPGWAAIGKSSGLVACMHTEARRKWEGQVTRCEFPPLTMGNINEALGSVHNNRRDVLEEGVVAVFKSLSYDFKSNAPVKFGKRAVIERFHMGTPHWYSPGPEKCGQVDDLLRLMQLADGKVDHATYVTLTAMNASDVNDTGATTLENEYYTLRVFKKGTAHIVFKRQDLVDKLNQAIGKRFPNALPPPV